MKISTQQINIEAEQSCSGAPVKITLVIRGSLWRALGLFNLIVPPSGDKIFIFFLEGHTKKVWERTMIRQKLRSVHLIGEVNDRYYGNSCY